MNAVQGTRVDATQLPRRTGEIVEIDRLIEADLKGAISPLLPAGPLLVSGTFTGVDDGVYADLVVRGEATGGCVRCLEPLTRPIDTRVQELFVEPAAQAKALADGDEEAADWYLLDREGLDLAAVIIDIVIGGLDDRPLCESDCAGLCDQCGVKLADDPDHSHEVIDQRWAALAALRLQEDETDG